MRAVRRNQGFSLLEVVLALAVLVVGALVTLTVLMRTGTDSEKTKINAIATKACQDMAEALMSMPYTDLKILRDWSVANNQPLTFNVTAPGFPRLPNGGFIQGSYTLTDISDQFGYPPNSGRLWEIVIRVDYQTVHVAIHTRRKDPAYL